MLDTARPIRKKTEHKMVAVSDMAIFFLCKRKCTILIAPDFGRKTKFIKLIGTLFITQFIITQFWIYNSLKIDPQTLNPNNKCIDYTEKCLFGYKNIYIN